MGVLRYSTDGGLKLIVEVDPGIIALARALVPPAVRLQPQRYDPHITVVRNELPDLEGWGEYEGGPIPFKYDPLMRNDERYYWLDVYSPILTTLRLRLGLPVTSEWTRPPDGRECFHCTVGNTKGR